MGDAATLTDSPDARLKHGKRLTEAEKRAIVAAVAVNGSIQDTAQQFGVHRNTVGQLVQEVRDTVVNSEFSGDWRSKHKNEAVTAVTSGLTCEDDPYKRATIGVSVLKGLGEYQGDNQLNVTVSTMIAAVPAEWREEMIGTPEAEITEPTPKG